jgi:oligopeptide/dipeptide ABC transporter ATP-binding protein
VEGVSEAPLLRARDLVRDYSLRGGGRLRAVAGVSFDLAAGQTLGIVGESGCGKSTLGRLLVGLEPPTAGTLEIGGRPAVRLRRRELARQLQLVFQDPFSSLNPRRTVGSALAEALRVHGLARGREGERVRELLAQVALPAAFAERYPHEISGGQAQRVGIARSLAPEPRVLVLDEPTSALDVSVRAEIMNLLAGLRDRLGLAYVFISHDVAMIRHISDRVGVMYLGRFVELGGWREVLSAPLHPYTIVLRAAVPEPDPELEATRRVPVVGGEVPSAAHPPAGCVFHPRCPVAEDRCRTQAPALAALRPAHMAACHVAASALAEEADAGTVSADLQRRASSVEE